MKYDLTLIKENKKTIAVSAITFVVLTILFKLFGCFDTDIAMVDAQAVVVKSSKVAILKKEQEQKMQALQTWIDNAKADVEKQKNKKSKDKLLDKYNKEFAQKQQALASEYVLKLQEIDKEITAVIEKEAKRLGYDAVFAKGVVLYGATDITDKVEKNIK